MRTPILVWFQSPARWGEEWERFIFPRKEAACATGLQRPGEGARRLKGAVPRAGPRCRGRRPRLGKVRVGPHLENVLLLQHRAHFQGRAVFHVLDVLDQLQVVLGEKDLMAGELLQRGSPVPEQRLRAEGRARMGGGAARRGQSLPEPRDHFPPAARTPPCGLDW